MIGLCGAHRTGKSTLAKLYAEQAKIPYLELPKVLQRLGLVPADIKTIRDRLMVQKEILKAAEELYSSAESIFITDRTPLDMAAYMLADAEQVMDEDVKKEMADYLDRCLAVTNHIFGAVIVMPPVLPYKQEEGKPPQNVAYQEKIHLLVNGLASDERCKAPTFYLYRSTVEMQRRIEFIGGVHAVVLQKIEALKDGATIH